MKKQLSKAVWFARLAAIRLLAGKRISLMTGMRWEGNRLMMKEGRIPVFLDTELDQRSSVSYDASTGWPKETPSASVPRSSDEEEFRVEWRDVEEEIVDGFGNHLRTIHYQVSEPVQEDEPEQG